MLQEKLKKRALEADRSRISFFPNGVQKEYKTVVSQNKSMHNMIEEIRKRNEDHESRKHKEMLE
jgi:hypothetical protein